MSFINSLNAVEEIGLIIKPEGKLQPKEEMEEFMSVYNQLVHDIVENPEFKDMLETNLWIEKVLQYNVPHGKRNRGLATVLAYRYLTEEITEKDLRLSRVLGWCVEILQAFYLLADDIMDQSETRRGQLCWYKVDNMGPIAFNDGLLLESIVYTILKKYFGDKSYYTELLDIFHDVNFKTVYGESLDNRTGIEKNLESYTMKRYSAIVKYKTSFYSFYLPIRLAMALTRVNQPEFIEQVKTVSLEMGHLFQVQDDYLDCFGDEKITGKIGTDIQDSKCSWLFVKAIEKLSSNPERKKSLMANYGQVDPVNIGKVKTIYLELGLPQIFESYEEQTFNRICSFINQMDLKLPKQLFMDMLKKIYRRKA